MARVDESIFKDYDIRGTYPDQLDADLFYRIGRAYAAFLNEDRIVVGRDMRLSGPILCQAFVEGLRYQGADVVDIGLCSTDMLYFASGILDLPGAMFTASHNPKEYNGLKLCRREARPISIATGIADIRDMVVGDRFPEPTRTGDLEHRDLLQRYADHVLGFIDIQQINPLTVVVDAGNGMAGLTVPPVFDRLPCKLIPHCFDLDGSFPHHQPDPINPDNISLLAGWVLEAGADLGMAFDGDADRVFLVDDNGQPVSGSLTNAILVERILKKDPGEKIIYNVINSWVVPETIHRYGGIPIRERVGHSFIKQTMLDTGAIYAGEHSGHYYFRDNYNADSGLIAAMIVLEIISAKNEPLSEALEPFKKYYASGEINSRVENIPAKIDEISSRYSDGKQDRLDGLTVEYEGWWFNLRPSNTEPLIRLNVEARTEGMLREKQQELLDAIRS